MINILSYLSFKYMNNNDNLIYVLYHLISCILWHLIIEHIV
ncbi:hypothetical protein BMW23_1213 [Bodo saltans virus]|uniref:Uncharacterized protein n=1 Tax=Bodo saltans virus TaxID=2024608 RepID=A0A2H4UWI1_9VIRU|nr:hypothetical protein QJ851_gp1193 [Bodo saltans virus]ATZ81256.1 hypothetical protein BMW23_1213 [Bodo saltans virus]